MKILFKLTMLLVIGSLIAFALNVPPAYGVGFMLLSQVPFYFWSPPAGSLLFAFDLSDLDEPDQDANMGGFTVDAYLALTKDIESEPALVSDPSTAEQAVKLSGSYTMTTEGYFIKVYATPRTLGMTAESQGEIDGKSFMLSGELLHPSTGDAARATAKKINNRKGVLIFIDPNNGERVVVGTKALPVFFTASVEFGTAKTDQRGVRIAFECDAHTPGFSYDGAIPLSGSSVPPLS